MPIPNEYVSGAPKAQNLLDLFKDMWLCDVPPSDGEKLESGPIPAFEDGRIEWMAKALGGFAGCRVLELGPCEAAHTYMLERMGARSVLAIEANTYSYLKCLVVKEITRLNRSRFLLGDFVQYLRESPPRFDVTLASGVLYHMRDPAELLYLISQTSDAVAIWTHYYEQEAVKRNPAIADRFEDGVDEEFLGIQHRLYKYRYTDELELEYFNGGNAPYSRWMSRDGILKCLEAFGFSSIEIGFEQEDHPNGPAFCVLGVKEGRRKPRGARLWALAETTFGKSVGPREV